MNIHYFVTCIYKHIVIYFRNVREGKLTFNICKIPLLTPSGLRFGEPRENGRSKERTDTLLINILSISLLQQFL